MILHNLEVEIFKKKGYSKVCFSVFQNPRLQLESWTFCFFILWRFQKCIVFLISNSNLHIWTNETLLLGVKIIDLWNVSYRLTLESVKAEDKESDVRCFNNKVRVKTNTNKMSSIGHHINMVHKSILMLGKTYLSPCYWTAMGTFRIYLTLISTKENHLAYLRICL